MASTLPIDLAAQYNSQSYSVGPMYALLEALINASWLEGLGMKEEAKEAANAALNDFLAQSQAPTMTPSTLTPMTVDEPAVTIPTMITVDDAFDKFKSEYLDLATWLAGKFSAVITDFFPNDAATFGPAEQWIQDALANVNAGIPAAVQAQILGDDKDRIMVEANRAEEEMFSSFSARRMPLPPGGAAHASLQIQQTALNSVAESSRKLSMMLVENMKWAVEKSFGLRQLALNAATDYVKALASGPDMISKMTNVGYDAQSKLISAVSQFYNSRIQAKELTFKGAQDNAAMTQEARKANLAAQSAQIGERAKILAAKISSLTTDAAALFNNLHASAGASLSSSDSTTRQIE